MGYISDDEDIDVDVSSSMMINAPAMEVDDKTDVSPTKVCKDGSNSEMVCNDVSPKKDSKEVSPKKVCKEVSPKKVCKEVSPKKVCKEVSPKKVCTTFLI